MMNIKALWQHDFFYKLRKELFTFQSNKTIFQHFDILGLAVYFD
jgi:hypothetical protein